MTEDKEFFSALESVMNDMLDSAVGFVEDKHITTQKVMTEAAARGLQISHQKAMKLIKEQEAAGKLKHDGRRLTTNTRKLVNVWVAVSTTSPPKSKKRTSIKSATSRSAHDLGK